MAGLSDLALPRERDQLAALFEMRWRLFVRNMRRDEAKVSFVLWLTGRLLVLLFSIGLGVIASAVLYFMQSHGQSLSPAFHAVFVGWQLMNLFRGSLPQGAEAELYRFPLRFRTYVLLWLSAGALEGLTLIGSWICLGMFVGIVAGGGNVSRSVIVMLLFYALNLFMTRAVFLWLGRMLASRRARDIVLILSSLLSIGPQLIRMQHERIAGWTRRIALPPWFTHVLHVTPGYLAAKALQPVYGASLLLLLAWTAATSGVLLLGLHRAFQGEESHEFRAATSDSRATRKRGSDRRDGSLVGAIAVCEWDKLRHGGAAIYASLSPLLYLVFFGVQLARGPLGTWIVPIAAGYLALSLRSVNVFGQDGPGVQTYLLAPVPLRTILLGKNLFAVMLYVAQVLLGSAVLILVTHRISMAPLVFTPLWMIAYACAAFTLGNQRSLQRPTPIPTGKITLRDVRRARRSGGGEGWTVLLLIFGGAAVGGAAIALSFWMHMPVLAPLVMLPCAVVSVIVYRNSLRRSAYNGDILQAEALMNVARTA
jgi:ABC-2 type transport system permease protein